MKREQVLFQLRGVTQNVLGLFRHGPIEALEFRPGAEMRSLLELGNHFAAVPLVDLATIQEGPVEVTRTIEETLHGAGPRDWIEIFERGSRAVEEYFERLTEDEFETRVTRAHYGAARPQAEWLLDILTHIYHHRGQFYVYLRMLNVPVGVEHLYV